MPEQGHMHESALHACLNSWPHMAQVQFHDRIAQLVYTFPEDSVTSTGAPFWSAPKRFPHPLIFDASDSSQVLICPVHVLRQ